MRKKPPVILTIPAPCSQDWSAMRPDGAGRHCDHCWETVVDFTQMTDRQLLAHIQLHGLSCGRLRSDQLNRTLFPPLQPMAGRWKAALLAGAGALLGLSQGAAGKTPERPVVTEQVSGTQQEQEDIAGTDSLRISGQVLDEAGEPLIKWPVKLFYAGIDTATVWTDDDGGFVFGALPPDWQRNLLCLRVEKDSTVKEIQADSAHTLIDFRYPGDQNRLDKPAVIIILGGIRSHRSVQETR